jgi:hypothetical protein
MLPGPHELWLSDAAGQRYTTELRMVAVDRGAGPGPDVAAVVRALRSGAQPQARA